MRLHSPSALVLGLWCLTRSPLRYNRSRHLWIERVKRTRFPGSAVRSACLASIKSVISCDPTGLSWPLTRRHIKTERVSSPCGRFILTYLLLTGAIKLMSSLISCSSRVLSTAAKVSSSCDNSLSNSSATLIDFFVLRISASILARLSINHLSEDGILDDMP